MNKIYCGNLSEDVTEDALRDLFEENGISVSSMVVKRNTNPNSNGSPFAFVDVESEEMAQQAIDKLNDYNLLGSVMVVEHSVPKRGKSSRNRSTSIQVHNIPLDTQVQEIHDLLKTFGDVALCEKGKEGASGYTVNANYGAVEQAQQAIKQLNNYEFHNSQLKVTYKNSNQRLGNRYIRNPIRNQGTSVFPVRMLVPSDVVGAIIGKDGKTIKQITGETKARIDIHRRENPGSGEKAVTTFGSPEDCTAACRKVVEILNKECAQKGSTQPPLKLLAHNALVGRLIGKGGSSLKHIMQESGTTITISPLHELTICNPERTITIKGTVEQQSKAESLITAKLRTAYEQHMQSMQSQQQHNMFPGINHMSMFSGSGEPNLGGYPNQGMGQGQMSGLYYPNQQGFGDPRMQQYPMHQNETCYLYIPKEAVGAIIGIKGDIIKNMSRQANASIRIAPREEEIAQPESEGSMERKVTIIGSPESQWTAQFSLFDKIRQEGLFDAREEQLRCEIAVPAKMVGRIIGKKGAKVRDLQRMTLARIEVPRAKENEDENQEDPESEVMVKIYGHFYSLQAAQRRLRKLIYDFNQRDSQGQYGFGYSGGYRRRGRMNGVQQ